MIQTLNGVEFDLGKALPLLIGDWRALQAQGVKITDMAAGSADVETIAVMGQHILKKANPDIADDFINHLTIDQVTGVVTTALAWANAPVLDRPT